MVTVGDPFAKRKQQYGGKSPSDLDPESKPEHHPINYKPHAGGITTVSKQQPTFKPKQKKEVFRKKQPHGHEPQNPAEEFGDSFLTANQTYSAIGRMYSNEKYQDPKDQNRFAMQYTSTGKPFVVFALQVNDTEFYGHDKFIYVPCIAWSRKAQFIVDYGRRRMLVSFMGKLDITQVHLDDKVCRKCGQVQKARLRNWIKMVTTDIKIQPTASYPGKEDVQEKETLTAMWEGEG